MYNQPKKKPASKGSTKSNYKPKGNNNRMVASKKGSKK